MRNHAKNKRANQWKVMVKSFKLVCCCDDKADLDKIDRFPKIATFVIYVPAERLPEIDPETNEWRKACFCSPLEKAGLRNFPFLRLYSNPTFPDVKTSIANVTLVGTTGREPKSLYIRSSSTRAAANERDFTPRARTFSNIPA